MIAIDLSKQQVLDVISRAIQQISFTENLDRAAAAYMLFFIFEEPKKIVLVFSHGAVRVF